MFNYGEGVVPTPLTQAMAGLAQTLYTMNNLADGRSGMGSRHISLARTHLEQAALHLIAEEASRCGCSIADGLLSI